ncbi:hypothetical protein GF361_04805 [Candidatus Woesearchaeota archaeon]|nr:hypothetical protein [Candidatus Woesearchaeota archaeon]
MKIKYIFGLIAIILLLSISGCNDAGEVVEDNSTDNSVSGASTTENQNTDTADQGENSTNQTDNNIDVKDLYDQLSEEAGLNTGDDDNNSEENNNTTANTQTEYIIVITNFKGDPEDLEVKTGTTVTIMNEQENFKHVVGFRKEVDGAYSGNDAIDDWHPLLPGESYEYTFEEAGNFQWLSKSNYPDTTGEIVVTE